MAVDYSLPNWLIPKGFDAHLERMASLQAMEMGAREQQQKREFALRTDQFRLQQQKANLDMAGQVMSNQMMSDEMEDQLTIQKVFPQWQQGNFDASPEGLKTVKGMTYADRLKTSIMSQNTLGQARIAVSKPNVISSVIVAKYQVLVCASTSGVDCKTVIPQSPLIRLAIEHECYSTLVPDFWKVEAKCIEVLLSSEVNHIVCSTLICSVRSNTRVPYLHDYEVTLVKELGAVCECDWIKMWNFE